MFATGEFGNWRFTLEAGCKRASIICDSTPLAELLAMSLGSKRSLVVKSVMEDLQRVEVPIVFESDSTTGVQKVFCVVVCKVLLSWWRSQYLFRDLTISYGSLYFPHHHMANRC